MRNQNNLIAKEGQSLVFFFLLLSAGLLIKGFRIESIIFLVCGLFTAYFFRNPEREIDTDENSIVAPADGKVIKIEECYEDDLLKSDVVQISIFMTVFNVHINRVPVSGTVTGVKYHPGKFFSANLDKASKDNERLSMVIKTNKSDALVLVVQIAGLIARRIVSYPRYGDYIEKGKRYGLIRFGSRLDVYMPKGSDIAVKIGQKVKAGEVLGYLR
jgi:phosphatidylserine decarboxylase